MIIKAIHQPKKGRFIASVNNEEAKLSYEQSSEKVLNFIHTFVPEEYRRQGIATELIKQALEIARKEKLKVIPTCPFVKNYVEKHPKQYKDLIAKN